MIFITQKRSETIKDVLNDVGQVFFASILIEPIVGHSANFILVAGGVILSLLCWILSVYLTK